MNEYGDVERRSDINTNDISDTHDANADPSHAKTNDEGGTNDFFKIFPAEVFGKIPETLQTLLIDENFDRLATLVTLTPDDYSELETEKSKLKFGDKRLLSQMVEYVKENFSDLRSQLVNRENTKAYVSTMPTSSKSHSNQIIALKNPVKSDEEVKEKLMRSIQKTINTSCRQHKIDSFNVQLNIQKSTEGKYLAADVLCICGNTMKVYPVNKGDTLTWVTSSVVKHLHKFHGYMTSKLIPKITDFMPPGKSNSKSTDTENDVMVETINSDTNNRDDCEKTIEEPCEES